jgi:hypothetical protein
LNIPSYTQIIDENLSNVDKPKHPKTKVERKGTRWKGPKSKQKEGTTN